MDFKVAISLALASILPLQALAQSPSEIDQDFVDDLNAYVAQQSSSSSISLPNQTDASVGVGLGAEWKMWVGTRPPGVGIAVLNEQGRPVDMLGGQVTYTASGDQITVPGYSLPQGGKFEVVGSAKWPEYVAEIAKENNPIPEDLEVTLERMAAATAYIVQMFCGLDGRPSKITLHVDAGFSLVVSAGTGSAVEWDLDKICIAAN